MSEIPKGAILQRDKETYAIVPRIPMGIFSDSFTRDIMATSIEGQTKWTFSLLTSRMRSFRTSVR
jgi:hypothetical protein